MEILQMANAIVKWFNSNKGFGFLVPDHGGSDVFVHISSVEKSGLKSLTEGQKVSYELEPDQQGRLCAANIKVA